MPNFPHTHKKISGGVKTRFLYRPPEKYSVIFWNDDVTTFDFVIDALVEIFNYTVETALQKAIEIDQQGKGAVGNYVKPIAEAKQNETLQMACQQNFPLKVTLERLS